jgi:hypothetical protein
MAGARIRNALLTAELNERLIQTLDELPNAILVE